MIKSQWPIYTGLILAAMVITVLLSGAAPRSSSAQPLRTSSPTGVTATLAVPPLSLGPSATPTRAFSPLASPTPTATEVIPEPLLTLTAFNAMFIATFENRPTVTPGPSEITLTGKPHFVEFYADWCAPCRAMRPALRKMKALYGDQVTFWDVDIDNPGSVRLVRKYTVPFIPFIVLLDREGEFVTYLGGYQEEAELEAAIQQLLAADE